MRILLIDSNLVKFFKIVLGAKSYVDKPWAKHYKAHHTGCTEPKIGMKIVARASTTNERKIKEARVILKNNSDLNDKKEQMDLRRFLV